MLFHFIVCLFDTVSSDELSIEVVPSDRYRYTQSAYIQISLQISAVQSGSALVAILLQGILKILFANTVDLIRLCEYAGLIWSTLVTCIILDGIVSVAMRKDFRAFAFCLVSSFGNDWKWKTKPLVRLFTRAHRLIWVSAVSICLT